jgi:dCMP deaminase
MHTHTWDTYFIQMANLVASKSKDDSTKVGCIIVSADNTVLSMGYNGFPRGVRETLTKVCDVCGGTGYINMLGNLSIGQHHRCYRCNGVCRISTDTIDPERWHKRPEKYQWVEHAERNAVFNAARKGVRLEGGIAYLNWEPIPCSDCTRALIQAGIVEIVGPNIPFGGHGAGTHYHVSEISREMLKEAGVRIRTVNIGDTDE